MAPEPSYDQRMNNRSDAPDERELTDGLETIRAARRDDRPSIEAALDVLAEVRARRAALGEFIAAYAPDVIATALKAGYRTGELVGRPYSDTIVREIRRELNIPAPKPGPRPRTRAPLA